MFLRDFAVPNTGVQIPGRLVGRAIAFFTVAPDVCGVLRMGLAVATFLAPGIVWWLLAFRKKNCASLPQCMTETLV